jgi:aspartate-semialdehyde dehydrogenase
MKKYRVGILGATGMVGQKLLELLDKHPWFEVVTVAASPKSAGKKYSDVVADRWKMESPIPAKIKKLKLFAVEKDMKEIAKQVDFVFCALDMEKKDIQRIEEGYAALGIPVVSNNSANRWIDDVPMIMPEINPEHTELIDQQRKNRGWKKGLIAVKPNCSIQSYVSILTALKAFKPQRVHVVSLQAISGAGKTFETWPEMVDNVNPYIGGEEEKSEREPMKIWGDIKNGKINFAKKPDISATCIRVSVANGHMASVSVDFQKNPTKEEILDAIKNFANPISKLNLPSAPKHFIKYFEDDDRPQTKLDRDNERGMGISMGRLQKDKHFDWRFIALAHNTIRGAAGGAVLMAELLAKKGYL